MKFRKKINVVVEGNLDEQVVRRLFRDYGFDVNKVYGKEGKRTILGKMSNYNQASLRTPVPWVVLVDLDRDEECAPPFVKKHLKKPSPNIFFRVAVREIEAWLLADRERIADFMGVSKSLVPIRVEEEQDPKKTIIRLVDDSSKFDIKDDILPRPGSKASEGKLYNSRMIEFANRHWRPEIAAKNSDSLRRFIKTINKIAQNS
jgi:hypothetical protein